MVLSNNQLVVLYSCGTALSIVYLTLMVHFNNKKQSAITNEKNNQSYSIISIWILKAN